MIAILQAMVNGVVLGAVLAALVWWGLWLVPRRSVNSATRYAMWWCVLVAVALLPLVWMPWPRLSTAEPPPLPRTRVLVAPASAQPVGELVSPPPIEESGPVAVHPAPRRTVRPPALPVQVPEGPWVGWILAACGAASLLMLTRFLVSYGLLVLRQWQAPHAPAHLAARVSVWLYRCGSRRPGVRLRVDDASPAPFAFGPIRPGIVLPERFLARLREDEVEQIGLHEAAHLARRDDVMLLLQRLIEALAVWNPTVRWIGRRLELEREIACDDLVIAITGSPRPYAHCLTRVAEIAGTAPAVVAAAAVSEAGELAQRVEMLLDRTRHRGTRVLRSRMAAALAGLAALVWITAQTPTLLAFAAPPPDPAPPSPPSAQTVTPVQPAKPGTQDLVGQWIAKSAVRLKTAEARNGLADMRPLKQMIGDARIVSLGEATHGTREFFQLKHRMLEYLATEMGFDIFSIEASMPEAYRLNDYVLEGKGDPEKLLAGLYFWTWNTEEVLDMIRWMREFNVAKKRRLQFTGFDMQEPSVAARNVADFVARHDTGYSLGAAVDVTRAGMPKPQQTQQRRFGVANSTLAVEPLLGKRLKIGGYIRTDQVVEGYAGLWCRADSTDRKALAFANLGKDAPVGTTDWTRYSLELDVPATAAHVTFGMLHTGGGTAWFDDLSIEVDGKPLPTPMHDLGFESPTVQGFDAGGAPWKVGLDDTVAHTGKRSLRMHLDGKPPAPQRVTYTYDREAAAKAAQLWNAVVAHLTAQRDAYRARKVADADIAWAIQNARIVEQCLLSRAGKQSRDQSMAENVKWILDQNPGSKIVLWAHNGHVATGGYRGYEPMGAYLRRMYGQQMYVFGFAFHQGSFQARNSAGVLRDFTVGPAPEGSLDATFGAARIPIFALDLRRAPTHGPVAEWLDKPHKTRTIGALYSEDAPYFSELPARESFDGMLFVEKTTAARKTGLPLTAPPR